MAPGRSIASCFCLLLALIAPQVSADDGDQTPIVVQDPQYGEVLFYFYQEDYFPAIARTLAAKQQGQLKNHADDAELLLGGMYLSYGHHLEAAEIFERMLADRVASATRDRTWFFLAKIWYQRGYHDKAEQALTYIEGELPDNLRREALMLKAQILIDSGRFDEAIALLSNWRGKTEWASYAKFNLGVALVRSGRVGEARVLLDELGSIDPFNEELTSLRDKANLALGYALLQDEQPAAAKLPLQRVRLDGPFSNKALLGVGWADAKLENFQRALVPWMELRGRDLLDPAVQESMLAVPYAMGKLDSIGQAADHYLNAIEAFYEETSRLDRTIDHIESGDMFKAFIENDPLDSTGWYWSLEELPEGPEGRYLLHMLASHEFQEGLKNYRDLSYLSNNLATWQDNVGVFQNMLETRKQAFDERLPRVEDALARADIAGLVKRKLEFDSTLNNVEQSHDWLAIASTAEFDSWGQITSLERSPVVQADLPEARDLRDKIDLLKGVLQWQLESDFKDRIWSVRGSLQETGEALVVTQRSRRQIDEAIRREALRFADLGERVDGLSPRIEGMKARVENSISDQRTFLQAMAVEQLQAQKQRLDIYTVQARFALAAIYDIAASAEEVTQ